MIYVGLLVIVLLFLALRASNREAAKGQKSVIDELPSALRELEGFTPDHSFLAPDARALLAIDETSHQFAIVRITPLTMPEIAARLRKIREEGKASKEQLQEQHFALLRNRGFVATTAWSYRALLAVEIVEDGSTITRTDRTSQIGGAIVGGAVFGGVGALAGALSGSQTTTGRVSRIELLVKIDDMSDPVHRISIHIGQINRSSPTYKSQRAIADKWATMLAILIRKADEDVSASQPLPQSGSPTAAIADELRKLSDLVKDGVLNDEEFAIQKKRLLSAQS